MRLYNDFSGYDSFFVCGDIHGEFRTLLYEIKRKKISNAIVLIAGDCGIGFEKREYYEQLYVLLAIISLIIFQRHGVASQSLNPMGIQ